MTHVPLANILPTTISTTNFARTKTYPSRDPLITFITELFKQLPTACVFYAAGVALRSKIELRKEAVLVAFGLSIIYNMILSGIRESRKDDVKKSEETKSKIHASLENALEKADGLDMLKMFQHHRFNSDESLEKSKVLAIGQYTYDKQVSSLENRSCRPAILSMGPHGERLMVRTKEETVISKFVFSHSCSGLVQVKDLSRIKLNTFYTKERDLHRICRLIENHLDIPSNNATRS